MKKVDLYRIKAGLEDFGEVKNGAFAYKVIKNLKMINEEIELLNKLKVPSKEYAEKVQTKIQETIRKYAEVDKSGKPIEETTPEGMTIKVDKTREAEFIIERDKILNKEKELVDSYDKQFEAFLKVIEEDSDIKLIMFKESDIPAEVTVKQLYQVKELLVD